MASVPLRRKVRRHDNGIVSFPNAASSIDSQEIIKAIAGKKVVRQLMLDHIHLRDNGCAEVFEYICSLPSAKVAITEIDLRSCGVTDDGLVALSKFLAQSTTLKTLWLQNNNFSFHGTCVDAFITAVNTSRLETLRLSTNPNRNDFVPRFLGGLNTRYLRCLELSSMPVDDSCVPYIVSFISSPRCHLRTLLLNANTFSTSGFHEITRALPSNHTLTRFEMHTGHDGADVTAAAAFFLEKSRVTARNQSSQTQVGIEALTLLRHSRAALLPRSSSSSPPSSSSSSSSSTRPLPTELTLHILSFLAPTLSTAQRLHIFAYASTPHTLPPLLSLPRPSTQTTTCLPDPSAPPGCSDTCCMGSGSGQGYVSCRREAERAEWVGEMGCDAFDPGPGSSMAFLDVGKDEGEGEGEGGGKEEEEGGGEASA